MRMIYYDFGEGFLPEGHLLHAVDELPHRGHEVIYINPAKEIGGDASLDQCCEYILSRVKAEHAKGGLDLFFSLSWDNSLTTDVVEEISRMGIATVSFSTDDLSHPFRVEKITKAFDLCWTANRECVDTIKGYGAKDVIAMPWAASPHFFKPVDVEEKNCISFVGTAYGARARSIATMAQANVPVHVHGASPMDVYGKNKGNPITRSITNFADASERFMKGMKSPGGRKCIQAALLRSFQELYTRPPEKDPMKGTVEYLGSADFDEMVTIFSQSALSFGSIEVASTFVLKDPIYYVRVREFEAAMCGAVHLVNRFPELEEYFEEDVEMLYYGSLEELVDKAKFYLQPSQEATRQKIRVAARKRCMAEHTWAHRFNQLGKRLGFQV